MAVYAVALMVLVAAAATTTRPFLRLLRLPSVAAYVGAGWVWLLFGIGIGPHGLNALNSHMVDALRPLILVAIGWVGLTVGVQLTWHTLQRIPWLAWRWAGVDMLACCAVATVLLLWSGPNWLKVNELSSAWVLMPVVIVSVSLMGWNPETRSMLLHATQQERAAARLATGTAGLSTVLAVLLLGVASQFVVRDMEGVPEVNAPLAAAGLAAAIGLAVCAALAIRLLLSKGEWSMNRTLVVVMSVAALAAGIATELTFSPLLSALLCGAAMANLPGTLRVSVGRLLGRSERAVATLFFVLAGTLLNPPGALWPWVLVAGCCVARLALKPFVAQLAARPALRAAGGNRRLLMAATARQSALAVVVAVAGVLSEDSLIRREILFVVVATGVVCAAPPLFARMRAARRAGASA